MSQANQSTPATGISRNSSHPGIPATLADAGENGTGSMKFS
jgi:hypothetical protein